MGASIFFNELAEDLSIPLGHNISVFQAEMYAVRLSISILETPDEQIYICPDSKAMLLALRNPRVTSKLTWECIQVLNELAYKIPVCLTWVPGHSGILGNDKADTLAKTASVQPYTGPEPAIPVTRNAVQAAIRQWANKEALCHWQNTDSCKNCDYRI